MAKLHFKYASMNSGKSMDLIRTVYNYEELGFNVLVMKPKIDTKDGNQISSRVGIKRDVDIIIGEKDNIVSLLKDNLEGIKAIFIDEAQFLSCIQIDELFLISKATDIPVICYGLRTDFMMNSFDGSMRLLEIADVLEEIQTLCECGKIARFVGRKKNGNYEIEGPSLIIDGTDNYEYTPLCGECYLTKVKKLNLNRYR